MPINLASQLLAQILPWILLVGLVSILGTAFRIFLLPKIKGYIGEASINFAIKRRLDPAVYTLIPDVMLPTPDGTTQIDHIVVSRYGIFVLETKNYKGWIYGDEREAQWTQVIFKRKERFQNPLRQNYKHTKTLSDLTGIPDHYFKSLVVFAGDCTFKTAMPANVVYLRDFALHIKSFQTPIIKEEQVSEATSAIREWAGTVTDRQKAGHVAHVRQNKAPMSADARGAVCPRCGAEMALRTNRKDGNSFWGCTKYPACRGIRKAE
jgi:hypothetical protein